MSCLKNKNHMGFSFALIPLFLWDHIPYTTCIITGVVVLAFYPQEPSPPGSASGEESSVPFQSTQTSTSTVLSGAEDVAISSSPLPSNLGSPALSSTVLQPQPTNLLGLDRDGHSPEPESEEEFSEG